MSGCRSDIRSLSDDYNDVDHDHVGVLDDHVDDDHVDDGDDHDHVGDDDDHDDHDHATLQANSCGPGCIVRVEFLLQSAQQLADDLRLELLLSTS